jgi:glycosyltransferase involved in cell wall biosynthesis
MRIEFWSNTECDAFMTGLIRELRAAGHEAVHRFQIPNAQYRAARSGVARFWLRIRMYLLYPLQLLVSFSFRRKPCVSVVCSNTFFAPLLAALVTSRRRPVVHLVYDLFPDVLIHGSAIRAGGMADRGIGLVTRMTFRRCAANVFLGRRLLQYAQSRYGTIPNAVIIPVGADGKPFRKRGGMIPGPGSRNGDAPGAFPNAAADAPVTVLYCGNMGRMHDVSTLAVVLGGDEERPSSPDTATQQPSPTASSVAAAPLHFLFHANGFGYAKLKAALGLPPDCQSVQLRDRTRVTFAGGLPEAEWETVMNTADIALVTMAAGAETVVMPSKTYSAMVAGQAILAVCPRQSDLADTVLAHDCGWVVEPGDAEGLRKVLDVITRQPNETQQKRLNAWNAGHSLYDSQALVSQWLAVLRECG